VFTFFDYSLEQESNDIVDLPSGSGRIEFYREEFTATQTKGTATFVNSLEISGSIRWGLDEFIMKEMHLHFDKSFHLFKFGSSLCLSPLHLH
jgi:hypothetical protein